MLRPHGDGCSQVAKIISHPLFNVRSLSCLYPQHESPTYHYLAHHRIVMLPIQRPAHFLGQLPYCVTIMAPRNAVNCADFACSFAAVDRKEQESNVNARLQQLSSVSIT